MPECKDRVVKGTIFEYLIWVWMKPDQENQMARANTQPVRIAEEVLERLREPAQIAGRSLPMEVEVRLRESLEATPAVRVSPWARGLGRLVALLADELAAVSATPDEALLSSAHAAQTLFGELLATYMHQRGGDPATITAQQKEYAAVAARALYTKLARAEEFSQASGWAGSDALKTPIQDELVGIQKDMKLVPSRGPLPKGWERGAGKGSKKS